MKEVQPVTFAEARRCVVQTVRAARSVPAAEDVPLDACEGRVLARDIPADRDYPPVSRSLRDGFAVRAADLPGELRVIGEVRAGERFDGEVRPGEAVEIMTGAPVPPGADAVVMVEHTVCEAGRVRIASGGEAGQFINAGGDRKSVV